MENSEVADIFDKIADLLELQEGNAYMAVTDHSKAVSVAGGMDDDAMGRHADRIRGLDERTDDLWVLAGAEVDILKSGKLDLKDKTLEKLDWVVASVHYHLDMDQDAMTDRLLAAVESGLVHCLGHPTSRSIGKRDPLGFDVEKVFGACKEHGVCLEIDSQPDRLDLPDTLCRPALEAGLVFSIATDAHKASDFDFMELGLGVARRGWLERGDVLNTRTVRQLRKHLGAEEGD